MRTTSTDRNRYRIFLSRASEFLASAQESRAAGRRQAATSNAVHAGIAAADAVAVFFLGRRSAPQRHEDAVGLLATLDLSRSEVEPRERQLRRLLALKTKSEYLDEAVSAQEAEEAVLAAERLVEWARTLLPGR